MISALSFKNKILGLFLALCIMVQFIPLTEASAAGVVDTDPLRPQLLGGSLDAGSDNVLSIYVFGDALFQANGVMDILKNFAAKDGIRLDIKADTSNNEGTARGTYNIWQLFKWSEYASSVRPTDNGTIVGPADSKLRGFMSALKNEDHPIDHVILLCARDYGYAYFPDIHRKCIKWFEDQLGTYAPNAQLHLFAPPGFSSDFPSADKKELTKATLSRTLHTNRVNSFATGQISDITKVSSSVFRIGKAWESYLTNEDLHKNLGIDLYCSDRRNSSLEGSYFNACLLYLMLTGNSPVGMDVYGQLTEKDAKHFQIAAHVIVKDEEPKSLIHNDSKALTLDTLTKPGTKDSRLMEDKSEYNKNFNVLMATALAYVQRGNWLQYDQTSFTKDMGFSTLYRRVISEHLMAPEQATPQNPYYTDCSAWTAAVYNEVFGFNFKQADGSEATSTRHLIRYRDTNKTGIYTNLCVWAWGNGTAVSDTQKVTAMNQLHDVVQPGDIVVYGNVKYESNSSKHEGHAVLYVGNGYIIHCSGASQAAMGGADYNIAAQHDKFEVNGGMVIEPLEAFTSPDGYRNMFKQTNEVVVLRPFATGKCNTPTVQAKARLDGLLNIVAYKESSVSLGQTASVGQEVTFIYHVKNLNNNAKTVNIVEPLPVSLTYVSSDGKYDSSTRKVTISGSVAAGEEKTFTLKVKIAPSASGTIELSDTATINGVYLNSSPIVVGKTMNEKDQAAIGYLLSELNGYKDGYDLAKAIYSKLNCTLPFTSGRDALTNVLEYHSTSSGGSAYTGSYSNHFVLTDQDTKGFEMLAPHLFGGQYDFCNIPYRCCSLHGKNREERFTGPYMRVRYLDECYFIPGDLLIYAETPTDEATVYIYGGDSTFYTADSKGVQTVSGSSVVHLLESMMAKAAFCVLRPSLTLSYSTEGITIPQEPITPVEPPHEHNWGEGNITKSATCKEEGVRTFTCSVCQTVKTETIAKLTEHTYDGGKIEGETKTYTCLVCSETKTEKVDVPTKPDEPAIPDEPDAPVEPDTPAQPEIPSEPDTPTAPDAPISPGAPSIDTPAEPSTPAEDVITDNDITSSDGKEKSSFPWWIFIIIAVIIAAIIVILIRKRNK